MIQNRLYVLATVLWVGGCATPGAGSTDPGSVGEGACPIEARNEADVPLSVSYRGGLVQLGSVPPGGRLRFDVDCAGGAVVVQGARAARQNEAGATCSILVRVSPIEGRIVVARLRMDTTAPKTSNPTGCRRGEASEGRATSQAF